MAEIPPIVKRLKESRTLAGLSQKRLGILAGIDQFSASARINQYERGKHVPDFATTNRLAKVLGVPTSYMYTSDDELAEMIILFSRLTKSERKRALQKLKNTDSPA